MQIEALDMLFSVCKVSSIEDIDFSHDFIFYAKTEEEISVVCPVQKQPRFATHVESGWRGFRICGTLNFDMIGIIAKISAILAENKIGIFVVSTFNTDYIFVKEPALKKACTALQAKGYEVL